MEFIKGVAWKSFAWGVHEQNTESRHLQGCCWPRASTSLRRSKNWISLCGLINHPIRNPFQNAMWRRDSVEHSQEYRVVWVTHSLWVSHTHTECVFTSPVKQHTVLFLWTFQSWLQLTARPAASHVNLIKSFSLRLWRLICLSLLSPLAVRLLYQHTHTH